VETEQFYLADNGEKEGNRQREREKEREKEVKCNK